MDHNPPLRNGMLLVEHVSSILVSLAVLASLEVESDKIFGYCLIGSILGSWGYILKFKVHSHENIVSAFLGNAVFSVMFSPFLCELMIPPQRLSMRSCLFVSAAIAFSASWIIGQVFPEFGDKVLLAIRKITPSAILKWVKTRILGIVHATLGLGDSGILKRSEPNKPKKRPSRPHIETPPEPEQTDQPDET
jgi:hypothetical protein